MFSYERGTPVLCRLFLPLCHSLQVPNYSKTALRQASPVREMVMPFLEDKVHNAVGAYSIRPPRLQENASPYHSTVGLCLRFYEGPRGAGVLL